MARRLRIQYPGAIYHWDRPGAGQQFAAVMETRRQAELEEEFKPLRRGWCLGSEPFRAEILQ